MLKAWTDCSPATPPLVPSKSASPAASRGPDSAAGPAAGSYAAAAAKPTAAATAATAAATATAAKVAAAEASAAAGGGAYQELLCWAYSPDSVVSRGDLGPAFLEAFLACPLEVQHIAVGYLKGREQVGMFKSLASDRRQRLMMSILKEISEQVSGPPPTQQIEALLSAPESGHSTGRDVGELGGDAVAGFLACPSRVQHMVIQVYKICGGPPYVARIV